jgi:hypothetical protein
MTGANGDPYTPEIVDGSFGPISVKALQWELNHDGIQPPLAVDGSYGRLTSTALETLIGAPHYSNSAQWLWPGRANTNATHLQHYLAGIGFVVGVTGVWDTNTTKGVQLGCNSGGI